MGRPVQRLLAQNPLNLLVLPTRSISRRTHGLPFSNSAKHRSNSEDEKPRDSIIGSFFRTNKSQAAAPPKQSEPQGAGMGALAGIFRNNNTSRSNSSADPFLDVSRVDSVGSAPRLGDGRFDEPHHFHVFATKHNTHMTLTRPNREPIISLSTGNIGFTKSARKHYDSAFQLAGFMLKKIQDEGINAQIKRLEVVLRGHGQGREAFKKALLGFEGQRIRGKVVKVSDSTRLKFGGTRSRKPRRLG